MMLSSERFHNRPGNMEVPEMNRIECASQIPLAIILTR